MKSSLFFGYAAPLVSALLLSACAGGGMGGGGVAQQGTYKIGKPYQVNNVWYHPQERFQHVETGIASWYGPSFHGKKTANGETYDQMELSAAHRTLQMPSFARVTNLENGRSVVVRVNDRGPYLRGRVIDVSKRAAQLLDFIDQGTARVRVEVLGDESRKLAEVARSGVNTAHFRPEDLDRVAAAVPSSTQPAADDASMPVAAPVLARAPASSLDEGEVEDLFPESLQVPTITVEELKRPGLAAPRMAVSAATPVSTHVSKGRAMPDPVVSTEVVRPTGLFVQAGAFSVEANAAALAKKLSSVGPTTIEPAMIKGRRLFRVKVGPLATVAQADAALEKVIAAGQSGARVVKSKS